MEKEEIIAEALAKAGLQEPFLFRTLSRARRLADSMLDAEGKLLQAKVPSFKEGVQAENDQLVIAHFERVLTALNKNKQLSHLLKRFTMPVGSRYVENLIRHSLNASSKTKITTRLVRQAVLSALLTPLRQNVGSCFATAPAIIVQNEQYERFLIDLYDLMMTGRLVRTFDGKEHAVPISPSSGVGDLKKPFSLLHPYTLESIGFLKAFKALELSSEKVKQHLPQNPLQTPASLIDHLAKSTKATSKKEEAKAVFKAMTEHALLKTWEYTLASFSDYKVEFYRWNLYTSLGFDPELKGGVGEFLHHKISQKLDQTNKNTEKLHEEYAHAVDEVRMTQALLRQAASYDRVRQLKAELTMRNHHAQSCEEMRNASHQSAEELAQFFKFLIEQYSHYFPHYFQEIYDAEMHDVETALYEDAPAGFRLLYKHGRYDPIAWTTIHDEKEYIKALEAFFQAVEPQLSADCETDVEKTLLSHLTTDLLHHLRTETFLESAFLRMRKAHSTGKASEKKPWSYTSGGTVETLLRCYFAKDQEFTQEKRPIHGPMDLLVFLLDMMKNLPYKITRLFESNPSKGMLMVSPTHAFIFHPGLTFFKKGWLDKGFSYTWARDQVLLPGKNFYDAIQLSREEQRFLAEKFIDKNFSFEAAQIKRQFTPHGESLNLKSFRDHLIHFCLDNQKEMIALGDRIDGFLRTAFPLLTPADYQTFLSALPQKIKEKMPSLSHSFCSSCDLYDHLVKHTQSHDLTHTLLEKQNLLPPSPLLFADTNWSRFYFGFAYNPKVQDLDLWRFDYRMREGQPLSTWRSFLDGTNPKPWSVFASPDEYSGQGLPYLSLISKKV